MGHATVRWHLALWVVPAGKMALALDLVVSPLLLLPVEGEEQECQDQQQQQRWPHQTATLLVDWAAAELGAQA